MTTDFRALCAELVESVEVLLALRPAEARPLRTTEDRLSRARAALTDGPAVPQGREPAAVTGQPSDEELWELYQGPRAFSPIEYACDLLARRGNPTPQPPADGEVAELVTELQSMATDADRRCRFSNAERFSRAADLLQRLSPPQPVPVSEQWPEFSDCDDADRVWCWSWAIGTWRLSRINQSIHTHWLPAHALPLPEVGE